MTLKMRMVLMWVFTGLLAKMLGVPVVVAPGRFARERQTAGLRW